MLHISGDAWELRAYPLVFKAQITTLEPLVPLLTLTSSSLILKMETLENPPVS